MSDSGLLIATSIVLFSTESPIGGVVAVTIGILCAIVNEGEV